MDSNLAIGKLGIIKGSIISLEMECKKLDMSFSVEKYVFVKDTKIRFKEVEKPKKVQTSKKVIKAEKPKKAEPADKSIVKEKTKAALSKKVKVVSGDGAVKEAIAKGVKSTKKVLKSDGVKPKKSRPIKQKRKL